MREVQDIADDVIIHQKVLAKRMLGAQAELLQDAPGRPGIRQRRVRHQRLLGTSARTAPATWTA